VSCLLLHGPKPTHASSHRKGWRAFSQHPKQRNQFFFISGLPHYCGHRSLSLSRSRPCPRSGALSTAAPENVIPQPLVTTLNASRTAMSSPLPQVLSIYPIMTTAFLAISLCVNALTSLGAAAPARQWALKGLARPCPWSQPHLTRPSWRPQRV